jgi:hypothetical protein
MRPGDALGGRQAPAGIDIALARSHVLEAMRDRQSFQREFLHTGRFAARI